MKSFDSHVVNLSGCAAPCADRRGFCTGGAAAALVDNLSTV